MVHDIIAQSKNIAQIDTISFSGGEPIIDPWEFRKLVWSANDSGKQSAVLTNASWAANYEDTFELLASCRNNNLTGLGVSLDKYHLEFVPIENISNVLLACERLGIRSELRFVTVKGDKIGSIIDQLDSTLTHLNTYSFPCSPVGAAKKNFPCESFIRDVPIWELKCGNKDRIGIHYNGEVYPCCSHWVYTTALSLGNIRTMPLKDIFHKLKRDPIYMYLSLASFDELVKHAKKVGIPLPEKVTSVCELCSILFGKKNFGVFASFIRDYL